MHLEGGIGAWEPNESEASVEGHLLILLVFKAEKRSKETPQNPGKLPVLSIGEGSPGPNAKQEFGQHRGPGDHGPASNSNLGGPEDFSSAFGKGRKGLGGTERYLISPFIPPRGACIEPRCFFAGTRGTFQKNLNTTRAACWAKQVAFGSARPIAGWQNHQGSLQWPTGQSQALFHKGIGRTSDL